MILDVDIGNSRLKWRFGELGGAISGDSLDVLAKKLGSKRPQYVRAGCVASAKVQSVFQDFCIQTWGIKPRFAAVHPGVRGLDVAYKEVARLGVDRWLAMLAACEKFDGCDVVVVDAGSALTLDVVDAKRKHLGGYIVPGWGRVLTSIFAGYGRVEAQEARLSQIIAPGISTVGGVSAGCSAMYQGFFELVFREIGITLSQAKVVLTGGDADAFLPIMKSLEVDVCPTLVLDGLKFAVPILH